MAERVEQFKVLDGAGIVPACLPFVVGLVIALGDIVVARRDTGLFAALDQVFTGPGMQGRNAALGEREMIGAIVVTGLRHILCSLNLLKSMLNH